MFVKAYYKRKLQVICFVTDIQDALNWIDAQLEQHSFTGWKYKIY